MIIEKPKCHIRHLGDTFPDSKNILNTVAYFIFYELFVLCAKWMTVKLQISHPSSGTSALNQTPGKTMDVDKPIQGP